MDTTPYTLCGRRKRMNWIACEWTQANQSWVCVRRFYFCLITINIFANVFICYGAYRCWGPLKGLLFDKSLDTFADSACAWFMRQAAKVSLVKSSAFQGSLPNAHQTNRRRRRRRNHIINFKHCQTRQLCNGEKWNFIACQQQQQRQPLYRLLHTSAFWDVFTDDLPPGGKAVRLGALAGQCSAEHCVSPVPTRRFCNRSLKAALASCISRNRIWHGLCDVFIYFSCGIDLALRS